MNIYDFFIMFWIYAYLATCDTYGTDNDINCGVVGFIIIYLMLLLYAESTITVPYCISGS